jgi:hypothetical protein
MDLVLEDMDMGMDMVDMVDMDKGMEVLEEVMGVLCKLRLLIMFTLRMQVDFVSSFLLLPLKILKSCRQAGQVSFLLLVSIRK